MRFAAWVRDGRCAPGGRWHNGPSRIAFRGGEVWAPFDQLSQSDEDIDSSDRFQFQRRVATLPCLAGLLVFGWRTGVPGVHAGAMSLSTARDREKDPVEQFSVFVPNRMGRMHEVVRWLAAQEVHIMALSVLDTTDSTIFRIVVDDPDKARRLLEEHSVAFTENPVVCVEIDGEQRLQEVLAALVEAELNLHYTYPFLTRPGGKSALAISIEHHEVAEDALRRHQFRVLYQGDISR